MDDSQESPEPMGEDGRMRLRPLAVVSAALLSALVLAGCTSGGDSAATDSPTAGAPADLCAAAAPTGAAVEAVTVEGEEGQPATATFTVPLEIDALQRQVLTEGTGDEVAAGDLVDFGITAFDASTGEQLGTLGYTPGETLPSQISPDSALGQVFGCATVGTRVVAALPPSDQATGQVYVMDLLGITPTRATGEDQEPTAGFPTVTLADDGAPTIDVAGVETPASTQIEVLKRGDGETVLAGDNVLVQYTGVLLSDGTVFDSSWQNGTPASFSTTAVVPGFSAALVGQTAGSQVVAVVPPAEGYGDTERGAIPAGSTLVFVVDILATAHTPAQ